MSLTPTHWTFKENICPGLGKINERTEDQISCNQTDRHTNTLALAKKLGHESRFINEAGGDYFWPGSCKLNLTLFFFCVCLSCRR